jgi:hypothetical protein
MKLHSIAIIASAILAACGGGGNGGGDNPSLNINLQGSTGPTGTCPSASTDDVWIDRRLSCLTVGQKFVDAAAGYVTTGLATGDRAFVVNQGAYDPAFNNILGTASDYRRYWAYFLCVRNAPIIPGGGGFNLGLATDMQIAMGLSYGSRLPSGVGASTVGQYGGDRTGFVDEPCDPAKHPVIVDYTTGKIVSVNPAALGVTVPYTLP